MNSHITSTIISVVIPLYNKSEHITRAIDSVLSQTIQNFEVIVVNDGSTDGGEKKVIAYNDPRIRLINQINQGVSVARNNGVDEAQSELIAFLDADDEWYPDYLENILKLRKKYPEAGLYSATRYFSDGKKLHLKLSTLEYGWEGIVSSPFGFFGVNGAFPGCTITSVIPKRIFQEMGGFPVNVQLGEDWDLWGRIAFHYPVAHIEKALGIIHMDAVNKLTNNKMYQNITTHPLQVSIASYPHDILYNHPQYDDILLCMDRLNIWMATLHIENGRGYVARSVLKRVHNKKLLRLKLFLYVVSTIPFISNPRILDLGVKCYSFVRRIVINIMKISK